MVSAAQPKTKRRSTKVSKKKTDESRKIVLSQELRDGLAEFSNKNNINLCALEGLVGRMIKGYSPPRQMTILQIKREVYKAFQVSDSNELKKSGQYKLATSGKGKLNLSKKSSWEKLYRWFVGILPYEDGEIGYGCINGINVFEYDMPWRAFGLDPDTASTKDIEVAYRKLSKIYHPDASEQGDRNIFERITIFKDSLTEKF